MSPPSAPFDVDRGAALQELISRLAAAVAEAQVLTTAALRFDLASLAEASTTLSRMAADPALELGRTSDVYAALRRAVVARSPVRPRATPARSSLAEAAVGRQRSLVEAFPIPQPPQLRSPLPNAEDQSGQDQCAGAEGRVAGGPPPAPRRGRHVVIDHSWQQTR